MIEIKNLYLKYIREYFALYNINISINKSDCVAFVGKEHSGRTTLLRVIAGLEKYDSGEVFINSRDINQVDFSQDINLGYVPVLPVFLENKTVYENFKYVLKERGYSSFEIETKINNILIEFNIEKYKNIKAKDLDLYEKYLISFIRLTLRDLDILLIDNIFSKIEESEQSAFIEFIKNYFVNKKITTIIACDDFEKVKTICNKKFILENGSVLD